MNFTKTIVNAIKCWTTDKLNKKVDKEDFIIALKNAKSDWNQNDESADDYIKNRPFYSLGSEEVVTTILPKTTYSAGTESVDLNATLVEGQTYTVTWDDVAYECVARNYEGYLMLGNNAIYEYDGDITTDTGEPFAMETEGNGTQLFIYVAEEKDFTIAISCTEIKENVERLPVKYLPEGYPYKEEFSGKLVENKTVNISAIDSPSIDPFEIEFVDGNTYTVVWDGVTYECEAYIAPAPNTPSIGSAAVGEAGEGGNGEPFFCTVYEGQVMLFASEVGEHTISISGLTRKVVKISDEYLPELAPVATSGSYNDLSDTPTIYSDVVRYRASQSLTDAQKTQARTNIGAVSSEDITGVVKYSTEQSLTDAQKEVARNNIGAADEVKVEELISSAKNSILLMDEIKNYPYVVTMRDGSLVTYCATKSIEVTSMPVKTEYMAGEYFDPTGMVITATTYDGETKEITDYSYSENYLTEDMTSFNIIYDKESSILSVSMPITVTAFDPATALVDFTYTTINNGTYILTGWKQTLNGVSSTELVVPDNAKIAL